MQKPGQEFKSRIILNRHAKSLVLGILSFLVLCLILGNIALLARSGTLYVNLRQLNEREQHQLESVFPPLSNEKIKNTLKKFYPEFTSYHDETRGSLVQYEVYEGWNLLGIAYQIREDIDCPVCMDVRAFIKVQDGKISDIVLINPFHLYGKPMPLKLQKTFLSQFFKKKIETNMKVGFTVDGISGATKTAKSFVSGMKKIKVAMKKD